MPFKNEGEKRRVVEMLRLTPRNRLVTIKLRVSSDYRDEYVASTDSLKKHVSGAIAFRGQNEQIHVGRPHGVPTAWIYGASGVLAWEGQDEELCRQVETIYRELKEQPTRVTRRGRPRREPEARGIDPDVVV